MNSNVPVQMTNTASFHTPCDTQELRGMMSNIAFLVWIGWGQSSATGQCDFYSWWILWGSYSMFWELVGQPVEKRLVGVNT